MKSKELTEARNAYSVERKRFLALREAYNDAEAEIERLKRKVERYHTAWLIERKINKELQPNK